MTEPHPLFPIESDDDEPAEVGWIHVTRFEGGGQKWAPRLFAANELESLETLAELYGGGTYELVARSNDRRSLTARRRYSLPGAARSLAGEEPGAPMPVAQVAPQQGGGDQALLLALLNMMAQQSQANTQLMVAMLTRADTSSKEHIQSMTTLHEGFAKGQAELFRAMLEAKGGGEGGGGSDTFMKGIEFAQELQQGIRDAQEEDGGSDDLKELIEGAKMFMAMNAEERRLKLEEMKLAAHERAAQRQAGQQKGPPPNGSASP